jgi:hypothetical protein
VALTSVIWWASSPKAKEPMHTRLIRNFRLHLTNFFFAVQHVWHV